MTSRIASIYAGVKAAIEAIVPTQLVASASSFKLVSTADGRTRTFQLDDGNDTPEPDIANAYFHHQYFTVSIFYSNEWKSNTATRATVIAEDADSVCRAVVAGTTWAAYGQSMIYYNRNSQNVSNGILSVLTFIVTYKEP